MCVLAMLIPILNKALCLVSSKSFYEKRCRERINKLRHFLCLAKYTIIIDFDVRGTCI